MTASLASAKEISAGAAVLSELDGFFASKEEQTTDFLTEKDVFA